MAGSSVPDAILSGLAIGAVTEYLISAGRAVPDKDKRHAALAIAMGVLHGCCGPNGDFTSESRAPVRAEEA